VFVCIPPGKAIPKMTYTVSGGTLNSTHSLTPNTNQQNKAMFIIIITAY